MHACSDALQAALPLNSVTITVAAAATLPPSRTSGLSGPGPRPEAARHRLVACCTDLGDHLWLVATPALRVALLHVAQRVRSTVRVRESLRSAWLFWQLAWADLGAGRVPREIFRAHSSLACLALASRFHDIMACELTS